jgi:hypothetical protein
MLSKFAQKLLARSTLPYRPLVAMLFSTNSQKLQELLKRIQVQTDDGKSTGLL